MQDDLGKANQREARYGWTIRKRRSGEANYIVRILTENPHFVAKTAKNTLYQQVDIAVAGMKSVEKMN